nr:unnamed protein product [Callosobruchus chinensis]
MNDLDLIVMGATFASSTRNTLNSFVVGVKSGGGATYRSLGRVASGLNNQQLEEMDRLLKTKGKRYDPVTFATDALIFGREKPDYYIEPQHSVVFQIRATELIRNIDNSFATSYTLRFPRILDVRQDKPVDECLTVDELLDLTKTNKAVIKLAKGRIELEELLRTTTRKVAKPKLEMPTVYDTRKVSDVLEGYTIYLLNGTEEMSEDQAESFIRKLGGDTSFRLVDTVDIVLVGRETDKIGELVGRRANYDIVHLKWLQRIMAEGGNLLPYQQDEVYYIAPNYKNVLSDDLDIFGDSYTEPTNVQRLKRTFQTIERMGDFSNRNDTLRLAAGFGRDYADYNAYFDRYAVPNDPTSKVVYDSFIDEIEFRFCRGNVRDAICDDVNLLVFNGQEGRRVILQQYLIDTNRSDIELRCKSFLYE